MGLTRAFGGRLNGLGITRVEHSFLAINGRMVIFKSTMRDKTRYHRACEQHAIQDASQHYALFAGVNPTFVPFKEQQVNVNPSSHGPGSLLSIPLNSCIILTVTKLASVSAYCCPRQIRGPPLNGRYSQPGRRFSQRSGRYIAASGP